MTIDTPTVVYRGYDFLAVERLAEYLRNVGVEARVAVANPQCSVTIPTIQTYHEVLATHFDDTQMKELIIQWTAGTTDCEPRPDASDLFCFHCGEVLSTQAAICPACHASLE